MKHQHLHLDEINNIKYMISQKGRMKQQRRTNEDGKGVQKRKNGKYQATIRQGRNQKRKTLGTFATAKGLCLQPSCFSNVNKYIIISQQMVHSRRAQ